MLDNVSDGVWVALIGSFVTVMTSVVVPILMARQTAAQKAAERAAEWARQDFLADRAQAAAERAAQKLADEVKRSNEDAAVKTNASRERVADKLEVIHTLVNGTATEAMRNELASLMREVALRRELLLIKKRDRKEEPNPVEEATISLDELRIKELREKLGEKIGTDIEALEEQRVQAVLRTDTAERATERAEQDTDQAVSKRKREED